jgi:hypothetical protein
MPFGLRASRALVGSDEVAVFSFPLPPLALPLSLSAVERAIAIALLEGLSNAQIAMLAKRPDRVRSPTPGSQSVVIFSPHVAGVCPARFRERLRPACPEQPPEA